MKILKNRRVKQFLAIIGECPMGSLLYMIVVLLFFKLEYKLILLAGAIMAIAVLMAAGYKLDSPVDSP